MDDTMPELVDLPVNRKEAAIIGNVIRMAKQMDIKVLCEALKQSEQARFLRMLTAISSRGIILAGLCSWRILITL